MERTYKNLCKPIKIGNITFRNRMFSAPMSGADITPDCNIGYRSTYFYEMRAKGGAAAVTVSELVVHPETDASFMYHLNRQNPGSIPSFTYTADAINRHGSIASVEFSHAGQYAGTYLLDQNKKSEMVQYGPSDGQRPDGIPVRALTEAQMADIVAAYRETATLAKLCGFRMIMVHAGHGWLLNQFLSPYFNHRQDEYGGSLENRVRFVREILQAVREGVGPGFPIELRMSGSELFDGGYDIDEGCRIAQALEDLCDMIHVSAGSYKYGFSVTHPSMFREHGCNVYLAKEIKKHVSVPVATIGGLGDPAMMDALIGSGTVDVVYMGRALLADPELPNKVAENRQDEIVRCLRCFVCMAERGVTSTRRCSVNPRIGREQEGMEILPARKKKKVLVVGGGVAGLEAAVTAAQRGHQVTLCEKSGQVGGILNCEQAIDFKYEMYLLGKTLAHQAELEGVEIRLGVEVTAEYAAREACDAAIVAIGSVPIVPPIPGMDGGNVVVVNNYYLEKDRVSADEIVVLGGGLAGCESAVHLAREGKRVHLVEMLDTLCRDANIRHRPILLAELERLGVTLHTGHRAVEIRQDGVVCQTAAGETVVIPGGNVICAVGQRACSAAADSLRDCAPMVRLVGDCVRPANICTAIYEAYHAAMDL
ncbi:MAG: NAD(P)/FAD-dependent oxidoreductase [Oscillospiraceae bacterium]|nr:NAD(P)/FAD-dependent oxidoreductase [Oscillospiraceae bacterium]